MGSKNCAQNTQEQHASDVAQITTDNLNRPVTIEENVRMLLVGPTNSGKSTIHKGMLTLFPSRQWGERAVLDKKGHSQRTNVALPPPPADTVEPDRWGLEDRMDYVSIIRKDILRAYQELLVEEAGVVEELTGQRLHAVESYGPYSLEGEPNHSVSAELLQAVTRMLNVQFSGEYTPALIADLRVLSQHPVVMRRLAERHHVFARDATNPELVRRLEAVCAADYVPTVQDIMAVRVRTTGIIDGEFRIPCDGGERWLQIYDVGSPRNERKKFLHTFPYIQYYLYVVDLCIYAERPTAARDAGMSLEEELHIFRDIARSRFLTRGCLVLVLNKLDMFADLLRHVDIKTFDPLYQGDPHDVNAAAQCVAQRFLRETEGTREVPVVAMSAMNPSHIEAFARELMAWYPSEPSRWPAPHPLPASAAAASPVVADPLPASTGVSAIGGAGARAASPSRTWYGRKKAAVAVAAEDGSAPNAAAASCPVAAQLVVYRPELPQTGLVAMDAGVLHVSPDTRLDDLLPHRSRTAGASETVTSTSASVAGSEGERKQPAQAVLMLEYFPAAAEPKELEHKANEPDAWSAPSAPIAASMEMLWSPATHQRYPRATRLAIRTTLLIWMRGNPRSASAGGASARLPTAASSPSTSSSMFSKFMNKVRKQPPSTSGASLGTLPCVLLYHIFGFMAEWPLGAMRHLSYDAYPPLFRAQMREVRMGFATRDPATVVRWARGRELLARRTALLPPLVSAAPASSPATSSIPEPAKPPVD